jgi:DNA-directed RNA polymerase specialized sigma24 family protein
VSSHDADEAIQETAARVVAKSVDYSDADDLFRWAAVVSWRIAIDSRRRLAPVSELEVPDRADSVDVAQAAEDRIVLSAVQTRLKDLTTRDQELLLSSFDDQPVTSRRESVRLAVARHRARNRLKAMLDGLAAPVLGLWARRHRAWPAQLQAIGPAAVPMAACLLLTVGPLAAGHARAVAEAIPISPAVTSMTAPSVALPFAVIIATPVSASATPSRSRTAAEPGPNLPSAHLVLPEPAGHHGDAGIRPKQPSDSIVCVHTPPSILAAPVCIGHP